jgi:hypothetical protein
MASTAANEATVAQYLRGHGLSDAQVAGVMGNWKQESGFNDTEIYGVLGDGGTSGGLAQWHLGRLASEQAYVKSQGGSGLGTLNQQLDFFWKEYNSSYPTAIANSGDPRVVAAQFDRIYEGGTDPGQVRENAASAFASEGVGNIIAGAPQQAGTGVLGSVGGALYNDVPGVKSAVSAVSAADTGWNAITSFIGWFSNSANLLRVGYFVLGGILIVVGGAKAVGAPNPIKLAGKVPL